MIQVELISGKRILVNIHLIESIEESFGRSIIVTDTRRFEVTDSPVVLTGAIEAVHQEIRRMATEKLESRRPCLTPVD